MKFVRTLALSLAALAALACAAPAQERRESLTGIFQIHKSFHSKFLPTDRDVIVYLPPDYYTSRTKRYPVFYMHDGQNLFDGATSYIPNKEWRADEAAEELIRAGKIEPIIIVGIDNAGEHRIAEYTPTKDPRAPAGGEADAYGKLLVEELKPFIDRTYRTKPDAADTGLGGSSLGGLVSMYVALKYPNVFGKLALVSPSVWWDGQVIVKDVEAMKTRARQRIWIDVGTKEGDDPAEAVAGPRALRDALVAKGWTLDRDLEYVEVEGAEHNESAWAARFPKVLEFLYGTSR